MTRRLMWKVFFAFWGAILLSAVIPLALATLEGRPPFPENLRKERVRAAIVLMNAAGRPAAERAIRDWPAGDRVEFERIAGSGVLPDLALLAPADPLFVGLRLFAVNLVTGLICSIFVTLYLTRPLVWLRDGFGRLASGELDTRLIHKAGARRDEIADLARDFDSMAERLQGLVEARDRILHDLSHELRSPLARQRVAVGLARQNPERIDEALLRIEMETERLSVILGNFLTLSRMENGAQMEGDYFFDIGDLLRVIREDAGFEAEAQAIRIDLALAPSLARSEDLRVMNGAPELLRQALDNILRNAIRFTPPGGAIRMAAYVEGDRLRVDVCDEGPGVPEAMLATIFEPFVKGVNEARGIGLGLAIARRAVAAHKGTIEAANLPGGGLRMRIDLPGPVAPQPDSLGSALLSPAA